MNEVSTLVAVFATMSLEMLKKPIIIWRYMPYSQIQKKKVWKMSTGYSKISFRKKLVKPKVSGFLTLTK